MPANPAPQRHPLLTIGLVLVYTLFGLGLLAWPLLCYVTLFFWDAPGSEKRPEIFQAALAIWTYPIFYFTGLIAGIAAHRRGVSAVAVIALACLPIINFFWFAAQIVRQF